jgi:DNA-binding IscR family transcriptional regulator
VGEDMDDLTTLEQEVLLLLARQQSSYAYPISSEQIGKELNITPSYVRSQLGRLVDIKMVGVRRGNKGGYYIVRSGKIYHGK